jgi:hypothetical protein
MKRVSKECLSRFRQDVQRTSEKLKDACLAFAGESPLLAGTPVRTYKTCGKPNCKCQEGGDSRHGPYLAVQIRREGKQRNLTLKKSEVEFFEMAQEYQRRMQDRETVKELERELLEKVDKMIETRTIWDKK